MNRIKNLIALGCLSMLAACGSQSPVLMQVSGNTAQALKAQCAQAMVQGPEIKLADSLVSSAALLAEKKKMVEAIQTYDNATVLYRIALLRREQLVAEKDIQNLEKSVSMAQSQRDTYNRVLVELKNMKK